jgi:hypothetical protein
MYGLVECIRWIYSSYQPQACPATHMVCCKGYINIQSQCFSFDDIKDILPTWQTLFSTFGSSMTNQEILNSIHQMGWENTMACHLCWLMTPSHSLSLSLLDDSIGIERIKYEWHLKNDYFWFSFNAWIHSLLITLECLDNETIGRCKWIDRRSSMLSSWIVYRLTIDGRCVQSWDAFLGW